MIKSNGNAYCLLLLPECVNVAKKTWVRDQEKWAYDMQTINKPIQAHTIELGFNINIQNDLIYSTVSSPYLNDWDDWRERLLRRLRIDWLNDVEFDLCRDGRPAPRDLCCCFISIDGCLLVDVVELISLGLFLVVTLPAASSAPNAKTSTSSSSVDVPSGFNFPTMIYNEIPRKARYPNSSIKLDVPFAAPLSNNCALLSPFITSSSSYCKVVQHFNDPRLTHFIRD